jgi:tetratricopeptide (TPR) repeat protein
MVTKIVNDPLFDQAVDEYLDTLISQEKSEYHVNLEPFDVAAAKWRLRLSEGLHAYRDAYVGGYHVLLEKLHQLLPDQKDFNAFQINEASRPILEDPEALMTYLAEGNSLYQLLGFSSTVLANFFLAACQLLQEEQFEEAKQGFFFLALVAPQIGRFWLGLSYCYLKCHEYKAAELACARALDLDPDNPDVYLVYAHLFKVDQNYDKANQVCELGAFHAAEHQGEPWAQKLADAMEEAKQQIAEEVKR